MPSTNVVYSDQFMNYKNFEVRFDLSFGNNENSYKIDKLILTIDNKIYTSECTGSKDILPPFVGVTDVRATISCDIEVVKSNENIQEVTIDKLMGFITFTKEVRDSNTDTVVYPEIDQGGMNFLAFNDDHWNFNNASLKFDNKLGKGSLTVS